LVEANLPDALACRNLGEERAARTAIEQAPNLAKPDRLILPFAMAGAWQLLTALPPHGTSHAALVAHILDADRGDGPRHAAAPGRSKSSAQASFACCATCRPTSPGPRSLGSCRSR
jgi:LuxR family transcriptional regulator, maltose regulon positive regulatory protein